MTRRPDRTSVRQTETTLRQPNIETRKDRTEVPTHKSHGKKSSRNLTAVLFRFRLSPLRCHRHKGGTITIQSQSLYDTNLNDMIDVCDSKALALSWLFRPLE